MLYMRVWATSCLLISIKRSAGIKGTDSYLNWELKLRAQKIEQLFWSLLCLEIIVHSSFFLKGINKRFKNEKNNVKSSHRHINSSIVTYNYSQAINMENTYENILKF